LRASLFHEDLSYDTTFSPGQYLEIKTFTFTHWPRKEKDMSREKENKTVSSMKHRKKPQDV